MFPRGGMTQGSVHGLRVSARSTIQGSCRTHASRSLFLLDSSSMAPRQSVYASKPRENPAAVGTDKLIENFKEQNSHTCVPLQRHDPGLGCWVREQRSFFNNGKLQDIRCEKRLTLASYLMAARRERCANNQRARYETHGTTSSQCSKVPRRNTDTRACQNRKQSSGGGCNSAGSSTITVN